MDGFDTAAKTWSVHIPGCGTLSEPWDPDPQHLQKWSEERSYPLIVVFGGIPVQGKYFPFKDLQAETSYTSGTYMWDYMRDREGSYHIFVADSPEVDGPAAYQKLMSLLHATDRTPSRQILYLFSGGYLPGKNLLDPKAGGVGPAPFKQIFLVDIWMKAPPLLDKDGKPLLDPTTLKPVLDPITLKPVMDPKTQKPLLDRTLQHFYVNLATAPVNKAKTYYVYTSFGANNPEARDDIAKTLGNRAIKVEGEGMAVHVSTNATAVPLIL